MGQRILKRDRYLQKLIERKRNGFVKIITGIRRCGKSYLLNEIFYSHLIESGVEKEQVIRFAFDSARDLNKIGEDFIQLDSENQKVDAKKFINYIDSLVDDKKEYYLLLDEVQNLQSFEAVLNGYLRDKNLDIYVTGSNSKFLSKDVLTEFAGRGDEIHILPLSFFEIYENFKDNTQEKSIEYLLDDYMLYGGLPASVLMQNDEQKSLYLKTQINNLYLRDICLRNNLSNDKSLIELLNILSSNISTLTNPAKLSNTFKSLKNANLSASTIDSYIDYMQDSFILSKAFRYDIKGKKYINTPYKIYFEDIGLRNAQLDFRQLENTHIMENVIYNELRFRGFNVDVGVVKSRENTNGVLIRKEFEIDFVANLGNKRYYIQSAYDIPTDDKMKQELQSFDKTKDSFKKILIINRSIKPRVLEKGYYIISFKDFLINQNSLEW